MNRKGEKMGWIGGWFGGFIWLGLLSIVWVFQNKISNGMIGIMVFIVILFVREIMGILNKLFGVKQPETIPKLGRNDLCWCGSGEKYKKCHLESDMKKQSRLRASTCSVSS